jgi:hypothetical protein
VLIFNGGNLGLGCSVAHFTQLLSRMPSVTDENHRDEDHKPRNWNGGPANKAVRGHLSQRNNQGTNTQTNATAGKTKIPQNTAHRSWSCSPPLSNSIGDIMAIDTPKQVNATLMSVNTPSPSFMIDDPPDREMRLVRWEQNVSRRWPRTI